MKIIIYFIFFILFFVSIHVDSIFAELATSEKELLDKIIELESEERFYTALRLVEDFRIANPDSFEAKIYRCGLLNNTEVPIDEIQKCLDEVSLVDPTNLMVMMNYGVLYYKMGEYEEARDKFKEIMEKYPYNKPAESRFYTLSLLLEPENDAYLVNLNELFEETNDLVTLNNLIKHLTDRDNFEEADRLLKISEEMDENNPDTLTHRGVWYAKQGDIQSAERYFDRSLNEKEDDLSTLNNLGLLYRELGDKFTSIEYYQKSIQHYKSALFLDDQNNYAKAGIEYSNEKIVEINDNNIYFQLGLVVLSVTASSIVAILIMHYQNRQDKIKHQIELDVKKKQKFRKRLLPTRIATIIFTGVLIIPLTLAATIVIFRVSLFVVDDVSNWVTMIVEVGIGAIIATIILSYELSKHEDAKSRQDEFDKQQKKISKLVKDTKKIQVEHLKFVKEERERINNWKTRWGNALIHDLKFIKNLYVALEKWIIEYNENPNDTKKSDIIKTSKMNASLIDHSAQNIIRDLPNIENYFKDPVLNLNLKSLSKRYSAIHHSMDQEYHWESDGLSGTLASITEMKRILDRDIKRLIDEIPNYEDFD